MSGTERAVHRHVAPFGAIAVVLHSSYEYKSGEILPRDGHRQLHVPGSRVEGGWNRRNRILARQRLLETRVRHVAPVLWKG